jgi:hypothetical protein
VDIAGHRARRGSDAVRYLRAARMSAEVARAYTDGGRPDAGERFTALVAKNLEYATRADGYLGPTPTPGAPNAR